MSVEKKVFAEVTKTIIDNFEGGYYNPAWHHLGPLYAYSGETMFGLDRKNFTSPSPAWKKFWAIIDSNKNQATWVWNYGGGFYRNQLQDLAVEIMYPVYEQYASQTMSTKLRAIVESDPKLLLHFVYGVWNGAGWFTQFAGFLNKKVASGVVDKDLLQSYALQSRKDSTNSIVKKSGFDMENVWAKLPTITEIQKKS